MGTSEDAPQDFYQSYFAERSLTGYEWLAIEWISGLLIQLVYLAGGEIENPDFGEIDRLDFYGVCDMLNILEDACTVLAGGSDRATVPADCSKYSAGSAHCPLRRPGPVCCPAGGIPAVHHSSGGIRRKAIGILMQSD